MRRTVFLFCFFLSLVLDCSSIWQTQFGGLQCMLGSAWRWVALVDFSCPLATWRTKVGMSGRSIAHDLEVWPWGIIWKHSYLYSDPHLSRMLHPSLSRCGAWKTNILSTHRQLSHDALLDSFIGPIFSCIIDVEHEISAPISGSVRHRSISSMRG